MPTHTLRISRLRGRLVQSPLAPKSTQLLVSGSCYIQKTICLEIEGFNSIHDEAASSREADGLWLMRIQSIRMVLNPQG